MDYNTKTVKELREILESHNCAIPSGSKKRDLIALVEEIMNSDLLKQTELFTGLEENDIFEDDLETKDGSETTEEKNESGPSINDPEWHEYAMSHFQSNELIDGNPICAGLRRVAELLLGNIVETGPTQVFPATDGDGPGRATVVYKVVFNWFNSGMFKTFSEVADVWHGTTDDLFCAHPVATASTRAEGRALRKALKLRVLAAEELAKKNIVEIVQQTVSRDSNTNISPQQMQFIFNKCNQLDVEVGSFINMGEKTYEDISDVSKDCAKKMIKRLNEYQNGTRDVPQEIKRGVK